MTEALITPSMLEWARSRAELSIAFVAERLNVAPDKIAQWEKGDLHPSFRQAQRIAQILHIPFGFLFLQNPPSSTPPVADFRSLHHAARNHFSVEVLDLISDLESKQDWYRDYLLELNKEHVNFLGQFTEESSPAHIAQDISDKLQLTQEKITACSNWQTYYSLLTDSIESHGILVMRSGIVGSNTHRPLSVNEFRGIALYDKMAPIIFINGRDAKSAQLFTLAHELAHLWLGKSAITNSPIDSLHTQSTIESLCNSVAAELLVPKNTFIAHWKKGIPLHEQLAKLTKIFKVSELVLARRAYELDEISEETLKKIYAEQQSRPKNTNSTGGNAYNTLPIRNSKTFTKAVIQQSLMSKLLLRDAGKLLGTSPASIRKLADHLRTN